MLQKKALIIITFSSHNERSSPFKDLNVAKLFDIVTFQLAVFQVFMYKFHDNLLPSLVE